LFAFHAEPIPPAVRHEMRGVSMHRGCPVGFRGLRLVRMHYWDFAGHQQRGRLVVAKSAVPAVRSAFGELYAHRFPIRRMRLVDRYGGSDTRSIDADNTSAFNCRPVTGGTSWSEHAYGRAIDINPIENPYVSGGRTVHPASRPYLDRSHHRPGMAFDGGLLVRAFREAGWGWGGDWTSPTDYQHFSSTGR
jgi:hypothetical protein